MKDAKDGREVQRGRWLVVGRWSVVGCRFDQSKQTTYVGYCPTIKNYVESIISAFLACARACGTLVERVVERVPLPGTGTSDFGTFTLGLYFRLICRFMFIHSSDFRTFTLVAFSFFIH